MTIPRPGSWSELITFAEDSGIILMIKDTRYPGKMQQAEAAIFCSRR
jgi:hypothetical protein